jgi:hypothetical protein
MECKATKKTKFMSNVRHAQQLAFKLVSNSNKKSETNTLNIFFDHNTNKIKVKMKKSGAFKDKFVAWTNSG